ncbi:MAG TPA: type II toxin-antitoxin system VapC family toxin [Candidatus Limnocylindrales bacterium]|nr:type II toxin-antitoxin system VapC family toxin [Candidatus Limnocylindrales bacterium]
MTLRLLQKHRRVAIDSNVLIYLLEGSGDLAGRSADLLDDIANGAGEGVLSVLTLAEVCSGPARIGDTGMVERYAEELTSLENVAVVPIDADVAVEAALLRGAGSLSMGDALQLATARAGGATAFVTNDRRISAVHRLEVVYLDELS